MGRIIVFALTIGCLLAGVALMDRIRTDDEEEERRRRRKPAPSPDIPGSGVQPGEPSIDFFALSPEIQACELIALIAVRGDCGQLYELARDEHERQHLRELLVSLLSRKDSRMDAPAHDTLTTFHPNGLRLIRQVNHRVDDSAFKESLLMLIRSMLPPDSPLLSELFGAFEREDNPYTRMRIVRAVAQVGGQKAGDFLRGVVEKESNSGTFASQEAQRHVRGN